jgi:hypothetical protein
MVRDLGSVQQDKRGGTITADFVTGDDDAATVESMDSSVPDTPVVNNNLEQFKYGHTFKCYLINHLLSTILGGQYCAYLFHQLTEQPHQGDMNNPTSTSKR